MERIDRRRSEGKFRTKKDFRPLPENLRRLRDTGERKAMARFYALYVDQFGVTRRSSFAVKIDARLLHRPQALAFLIRATTGEMLNNKIPEHVQGEIFSDFVHDLFGKPWRKVRHLKDYKAGVVYGR